MSTENNNKAIEETFEDYIFNARNKFVKLINDFLPPLGAEFGEGVNIRTACEDILIAYDQMRERLSPVQGITKEVFWQLCPKCNGQGLVSKPPYVSGDVDQWTSSEIQFECDVCNGKKIIAPPGGSQAMSNWKELKNKKL